MIRRGHLDVPVIGVARSAWTLEQFRARARESVEHHGGLDEAAFAKLRERLRYVSGEYADPTTYGALHKGLAGATHPLHYLAIPPSLLPTVVERRYPAEHYVLVDDKIRILTAVKKVWGERLTTVFPQQGHYAHAPDVATYSPADVAIERIGDLLHYDLPALLGAARAAEAS